MAITVSGTNVQVRDPNRTVTAVRAAGTAAVIVPSVSGLIGPWDYAALTIVYPYPATTYTTLTNDYAAKTYNSLTLHI